MWTRTKIICTIGPASSSYERILQLIDAGMNVARLNFSHGTHASHALVIEHLKRARQERGVPLAILLDTKGPEIRVGALEGGGLALRAGEEVEIPLVPVSILAGLQPGLKVLFDDGYITSTLLACSATAVRVQIDNDGVLKQGKGVNIPEAEIELPAMTEQDVADIRFGCAQGIDAVAASFIRSASHVEEIKRLLEEEGQREMFVIAKIENALGVKNFDAILEVADGIMVARGDLGVELPLTQVPQLQKMIIRKCAKAGKLVVTATQMLESMIHNPRPTRAEVSDVANAIYDSTSCIMLSGETAAGSYPVEATAMMKSIAQETEREFGYLDFFRGVEKGDKHVGYAVALAAVQTAYTSGAKAVVAFTNSGATAHLVSRFRPQMPIFGLSSSWRTYHQMALIWGVVAIEPAPCNNAKEAVGVVMEYAKGNGMLEKGDLLVVVAGLPFGGEAQANVMLVEELR